MPRELLNVMWQSGWEGSLGEKEYMYIYGWSLCCPPETITTLLIGTLQYKIKFLKRQRIFHACMQSQVSLRPHGL